MNLLDIQIRLLLFRAGLARKIRNFLKAHFPSAFQCEYLDKCPYSSDDSFTCFDGGGYYCGRYRAYGRERL